jgi:hypothetical protein
MSSVIGTCTFNPSDYTRFPFSYLDDNGDQMASNATGLSVSVPGYGEPVCVFNTSRCLADVTQGTSGPGCCNNRQDDPPFWIPIAIQVLIFNLPWVGQAVWGWLKRVMPAKRGENVTDKPEGGDLFGQALMKSKGGREPDGAWMCGFLLVIMLGIAASICKIAIMPAEVQHTMQPTERAAQMAIGAFINPVREIFAFLEDSMATRVAYAMAAGRKHELNVLMRTAPHGSRTRRRTCAPRRRTRAPRRRTRTTHTRARRTHGRTHATHARTRRTHARDATRRDARDATHTST